MTSSTSTQNSVGRTFIRKAWLPVGLFAIWWILSGIYYSSYFPPLQDILVRTWEIWVVAGGLLTDLWPSILRVAIGFSIALVVGVALGAIFGLMPTVERAFRPLTEAFRAVPGAALLPIALTFFGPDETMKIFLIALASMWPIMLNTIEGVRAIHPTMGKVMETFHLSSFDRFTKVFLPAAAPQVFAGARIAIAISVTVMVVAEMFGTPGGVGYYIRDAQASFRIEEMWTGLIILGIFGYVLNYLFHFMEKRVLKWHHQMVAHTQGASQ
ncbi:ABC transporter permease [Glutamicibacter arilaitensis]|uniref:ABC transporter permease n=1 Tax=Glutamicibacter arilaitensis TaxID=256701 RepID=UPI00384A65A2